MDTIKTMETLKDHVLREIEKINAKSDMTPTELKNSMDAVCLLEKIGRIEYMEDYYEDDEEEDEGQSGHYAYRRGNSYGMMRGGRSYRNGRSGHYDDHSYNRDYGRSGHSIEDRMIDKLQRMVDEADSDYERQTIMDYINKIRR